MHPRLRGVRESARRIVGACGITAPPVDLRPIVKYFGLEYREVNYFSDATEAFILPDTYQAGPVAALVNQTLPEAHCRFSLAHQLFHYAFDQWPFVVEGRVLPFDFDPNVRSRIIPRGGLTYKIIAARYIDEARADAFAMELLLPSPMLQKELPPEPSKTSDSDIIRVAHLFEVRIEVAIVAVHALFENPS